MGFIWWFFPWGVLLQAIAIVHFIRRRPDGLWLWVIIFLGPLGALVYFFMEVVPDLGLLRQSFDAFGRRKRIGQLEAVVQENPSPGNYEELADLYLDEGKFARARDAYGKAISTRRDPDPDHAALPAAPRASLVPQGEGAAQAASGVTSSFVETAAS